MFKDFRSYIIANEIRHRFCNFVIAVYSLFLQKMESTGKRNRIYQDNNVCVPCICSVLYFDAYSHIFTTYF